MFGINEGYQCAACHRAVKAGELHFHSSDGLIGNCRRCGNYVGKCRCPHPPLYYEKLARREIY